MAEKHYGIGNANRLIEINGTQIRFTVYGHGAGAWDGFYSTSEESEQVELDKLVEQKELHIMEGWEIEGIKKKVPSLTNYKKSQPQQDQLESVEAVAEVADKELPEVEDILNVEKVAKPVAKKRGRKKKT